MIGCVLDDRGVGEREYLAYVPLRMKSRYLKNKITMTELETVLPVVLWGKKTGKYSLRDGNHRCTIAYELGYSHIPALIPDEEFIPITSNRCHPRSRCHSHHSPRL
jgi:hypothetical protein